MSLNHADNFNIYGGSVSEMTAAGRYAAANAGAGGIVSDPDGVSVPKVMSLNGNCGLRRALKTPTNKVGMATRYWASSLPANTAQIPTPFLWADASNVNMAMMQVNTTGSISFYVWDTTSGSFGNWFLVKTTAGPVIGAGSWWHIEAYFDASALTASVYIEGTSVLSMVSGDFGGHLHNGPTIYQTQTNSAADGLGASFNSYYKDYVIWDGLGSVNNSQLGAVLVAEQDPVSDVTIGGWVPSTGTAAWSILNQNPALTPNLAANLPVPVAMQVNNSPLPANVTTVKGLITIVRAAKSDGGTGQLQTSLISSGTTGSGANRNITVAQTDWEDIFENDPHTSAPWTPVAANAAILKIDRTV